MLLGEKAKERKPTATSSVLYFFLQCSLQPKFLALSQLQVLHARQQLRVSLGSVAQVGAFCENSTFLIACVVVMDWLEAYRVMSRKIRGLILRNQFLCNLREEK